MAALTTAELLGEALKARRGKESFEKALGRVLRRHSMAFEDYVRIMSKVRALAERGRTTVLVAAKELRDGASR